VDLTLPAGASAEVDLVQPLGGPVPLAEAGLYRSVPFERALAEFREYWDRLLAPAATFRTPEAHLNSLHRAVLAQLLINADGDVMPYGAQPSVYEGSLFGVEEGFAMIALAQSGLLGDAQRYMDGTYLTPAFLRKVDTYQSMDDRHQQYRNGLQPSYAVRTFRLSGDEQWIRRHLPLLRECAEWTIAARRQTMADAGTERPLHWGLLPEWAYGGDIGHVLCYALYANFACLRGLWDTAWLMQELGDRPTAERYFAEAGDYARCIERAVDGSIRREQTPPFLPMQLYASEPVGNDYDQLFDGLALDLRPFHPNDSRVNVITDWLEQTNQTFCRLPRFRPGSAKGGLDAIYSIGLVLTKLQQDRIDEFLLGFYGFLAFNVERDTFASRETNVIYASDLHARNDYGAPDLSDPVPCSAAVALQYLRAMLVTERWEAPGDAPRDLLLLHGAPRAWFADGQTVEVRGAPTDFGKIGFRVVSRVARGVIEAEVVPPARWPWHTLSLRLRHPEGLPMRAVTVNGQPWSAFDARRDTVTLRPGPPRFRVEARY